MAPVLPGWLGDAPIRSMIVGDIVAAVLFMGFVATAGFLTLRPASRRRAQLLIAYAVSATFLAGLTQHDFWPFVSWPLVAGELPEVVTQRRIVVVDVEGTEHGVDARAWYPMSFDELLAWMDPVFLELSADDQRHVAEYLIGLAEAGRLEARSSGSVGSFDRFLGPLTAPFFLLHPKPWSNPDSVPNARFVGLRYYWESWSPEALAAGRDTVDRRLMYELGPVP